MDLVELHCDVRQLLDVGFRVLGPVKEGLGLLPEGIYLVLEDPDLILEICLIELVNINDIVVPVLANGAPEADSLIAVLAEALDLLSRVLGTHEDHLVLALLGVEEQGLGDNGWLIALHFE